MIHKRYYSPFEDKVIIEPQKVVVEPQRVVAPVHNKQNVRKLKCTQLPNKKSPKGDSPLGFLSDVKLDDLILIGLILLLLFEEQEKRDMPLIVGLGVLLLLEFLD